ncbi:hypothetical protein NUSPORA_00184 [Nucleospora cyclopteri]
MPLLDFGNRLNENGKNMQLEYARKMLNKAPSVIGLKNSRGAILVCLKPVISSLHVLETEEKITKISEHCFMASTGIDPDCIFITSEMINVAKRYKKNFREEISGEYLKLILNNYLVTFNSNIGLRVLGAEFVYMKRENGQYMLYHAENDGNIVKHRGVVIGSIKRRAKTELEKLDLENMSLGQMVESAVKTFYKCYDPLVDKEFKLEIGVIGDETEGKYVRLSESDVQKYMEKYSDLSIED